MHGLATLHPGQGFIPHMAIFSASQLTVVYCYSASL